MRLHDIHQGINKHKRKKRLGRGPGSGHGKTSGRGHNGQRSRAGASRSPVFQGGAMPLVRRVPKRGFHNKFAVDVAIVNIGDLNEVFAAGDEVNLETLRQKSLLKGRFDLLKVLGDGQLTKNLRVSAHRFSKSAEAGILQAGGAVVILPGKAPVSEKAGPGK